MNDFVFRVIASHSVEVHEPRWQFSHRQNTCRESWRNMTLKANQGGLTAGVSHSTISSVVYPLFNTIK